MKQLEVNLLCAVRITLWVLNCWPSSLSRPLSSRSTEACHVKGSTCKTNLLNEVLYFILQAPPLEFDSDQFVGTHVRAVFLVGKLLLHVDTDKCIHL